MGCLELYKVILGRDMAAFRNTFANLALPLFTLSEPFEAAKAKSRTEMRRPYPDHPEHEEEMTVVCVPEGFTVWDKMVVKGAGAMTVQDLIDYFQATHKLTVVALSFE